MSEPVTEPLRAEHRELQPHLDRLDLDPARWVDRSSDAVAGEVGAISDVLRGRLIPHARAEEEVLYPAVEQAMGAPGATATMVADHREVVARTDRLEASAADIVERWPDADAVADLHRQLAGLSAIIELHFRKEEEVLLPVLDRTLTTEGGQ